MSLAIIVPFLNEAELLPTFLRSVAAQTTHPDRLVLVDDGSTDGSTELAREFAAIHAFAELVVLERRPAEKDRLATASELKAFHRALTKLEGDYDYIAKMDADLQLVPDHIATVLAAFESNPRLGVTGTFLAARHADGRTVREKHPDIHVPGPNKFYRRDCLEQIEPLPEILGWDGFDGMRARAHGWETLCVASPTADSVHLRPTGMHDGILRAYRRWGVCAWGWGSHPLYVVAGGVFRMPNRPYVLGGLSYIIGYVLAGIRRQPRVDAWTRSHARAEEMARLRSLVVRRG